MVWFEIPAEPAASVGVDNESTIVVYDGAVGQWAARVWWLFRAFGYDNVAVLDGGLTAWTAEGRETETGWFAPADGSFTAHPRPELWADKAEVERVVAGEADAALVCGLPPKEFTGEDGHRSRLGHIPGSLSVPAGRLVDRDTNKLLPTAELRALLPAEGHVVTYCNGGIAAAADALALVLAGHTDVALYDGSLNEWAADGSRALVSAAQRAAAQPAH